MDTLTVALAAIAALILGAFLVARYSPELERAADWWMDFCQKGRRQ
jgi:hypothetical protein